MREGEAAASSSSQPPMNQSSATHQQNNTAAMGGGEGDEANMNIGGAGGGVLVCPRGLAAIPLLCAAASESRSAYLGRLEVTDPSNGVRERKFCAF